MSKRLLSLDAFRGFTIAAMILVNNPGDWGYVFSPFLHAEWNGITPTDLIFPFFLFIVGVSIALAYTKRLKAGARKIRLLRKIILRTINIFLIGLLLNYIHVFDFSELRVVGVLQRIAIVFFVCSLLFLYTSWKIQAITGAFLLIGYYITMSFIPIPGNEQAFLEPGNNLAAWIDSFIVPGKMWQSTWDPEGFFSTLPAIATGILGMMTGKILVSNEKKEHKALWILTMGFLTCIVGYAWSLVFPANKSLWTSSYVLLTGGFASLTIAISIFIVDIKQRTTLTHIGIAFGENAIVIYVLADLFNYVFYQFNFWGNSLSSHFMGLFDHSELLLKTGSLAYGLIYIGILYIPAQILYKKQILIKL